MLDGRLGTAMGGGGGGAVAEDSENVWSGTFGSSRRRSEIMEGKENAWTVAEATGKRGF